MNFTFDPGTVEFRKPSDPSPPPVREPFEDPESPHVPVREPEPEEPAEV